MNDIDAKFSVMKIINENKATDEIARIKRLNKKHAKEKGWGWFVNPKGIYTNTNAGNVEYNNAVFNSAMGSNSEANNGSSESGASQAVAEGLGDNLNPKAPREFIETEIFRKKWKELNLSDEDLRKLQNDIQTQPPEADLGKGLFKFRFSPLTSSKGQSGSNRVIYLDILTSQRNVLLYIFAKNEQSTLTKEQEKLFRTQADELRKEYHK